LLLQPSHHTFYIYLGGILVGVISDVYGGRRACVIATFTFTLIPLLYVFAEHNLLLTLPTPGILILLGIMGCLIGGPINIITSAVAVDLAEDNKITGRNDLMTVTGLINGSGSIIASLGLVIIGPLQLYYGWRKIWYLLMACTCLGTVLLYPTIRKELIRSNGESENDHPAHTRRQHNQRINEDNSNRECNEQSGLLSNLHHNDRQKSNATYQAVVVHHVHHDHDQEDPQTDTNIMSFNAKNNSRDRQR
jgi:MFS family permease